MPLPLAPPTCDHCGAPKARRSDKYCRACTREGFPGPRLIGEFTKAVVIHASKNAIRYWECQAKADYLTDDQRAIARWQLEFFKKQYAELTEERIL